MRERLVEIKVPWLAPNEPVVEVVRWLVEAGQLVEIDQDLLLLQVDGEEFILPAPIDGTLIELCVEAGEYLSEGQVIAVARLI
ncbi:MAG TPA: hypothetical protein PLC07_05755 [Bacillota bacterium]|nr:hypothetical protein [Bacillota bacterium]HPT86390.1 hypothetical protein [Bacillota bacterium]